GRAHGLEGHPANAWCDIEPDARPVVSQGARLDLHCVTLDPVSEVRVDGDHVAVDVLPSVGLDPCLVTSSLGGLLVGESANPSRPANARLRVLDADHV